MRKITLYFVLIFTSAFLGGGVSWVLSYYPSYEFTKDKIDIADILKHSNVPVSESNFSCEGEITLNVGSVIGSIIELNSLNKRNMLSFGCYQNICTFMISNCMPWQDSECGSRILKFNLSESNEILPSSFICIDVP